MIRTIFILSIFLISNTLFSQNGAKNLLDQVADKAMSYKNTSIKFKHSISNKQADLYQETRGNVVLQGNLYHFNYMGTEQIFDGKKVHIILHEDEEVIIQSSDNNSDNILTPSQLFTFYQKGYSYSMGKVKKVNNKLIQYVSLTPTDASSGVELISIGVIKNTKQLYSITEFGKNGTNTTIQVISFETNQPISKKLFIFDELKFKKKKYVISEAK